MRCANFRRSLVLLVSGLLALEAGCLVGPNYHAPKVSMPGQWIGLSPQSAADASMAVSDAAAVAEYWKVFHDPELDALIQQAVQANLSVQEAQARIRQARESRNAAAAGLWPAVNASASNATSGSGSTSSTANLSPSAASSTRNLFQAGLDAAWELDFFGGVRRSVEAANANIQAAIEDGRDVVVSLTAEVALDYIQLRGLQQQVAIAQENLQAQRETAEITHKRFSVGFASRLDTANADAQVATTQSEIPVLEAAAQQTIYAMSVLLGRQPAALLPELAPTAVIPATPPTVPIGLPSDLLERRPDIRLAEAQLHAATAEIGVATADLFPKISLTGSAGLQNLTQGSLASLAGHFWSIGPAVTVPVFDAGRIRANIKAQDALRQQALLAYRQTVLTALQDVESALIAYAKDQQRRSALAESVKSNQQAVDLSLKLYTAGAAEFLNLLTAEHNLYSSQDALVQADRTIDTDLIALYKALGGGWRP
jgi:outer membrane protein, multidrug efflux system